MKTAARITLACITLLMGLSLAATLTACGGGDPEPAPDRTTQPVDCHARPEVCR